MTCVRIGQGAIACGDFGGGAYRREHRKCLGICATDTSRVVRRESSPYYGPDWYCADCGDSWCMEGLYPRPFERAWRKKATAKHEAMWERATTDPIEYDDDYYPVWDAQVTQ